MPTNEEITRHHDPDPTENPWVVGPANLESVEIVAYDPAWPNTYREVSSQVRAALGDASLSIEHIGSTSVEGLAAKEVIDIDLTVANPTDEAQYILR